MLYKLIWSGILKVGDVAQLGERDVRNVEARGSIPLISTKIILLKWKHLDPTNNQSKHIAFIIKCVSLDYEDYNL